MSAGRGTNRFSPVNGQPYLNTPNNSSYEAPPGGWGVDRLVGTTLNLTSTYAQLGPLLIEVPFGAKRIGLRIRYAAGAVGGKLGVLVNWFSNSERVFLLDTPAGNPSVYPSEAFYAVEQPMGSLAQVSPTAVDTTSSTFLIPIVVPPVASTNFVPVPSNSTLQKNLSFRVYARDAGGVAPGVATLVGYMSDSLDLSPTVLTV